MDGNDAAVTASAAGPLASDPAASGVGATFRAAADGATVERRRRSVHRTPRAGRGVAAGSPGTESGTWRLAL